MNGFWVAVALYNGAAIEKCGGYGYAKFKRFYCNKQKFASRFRIARTPVDIEKFSS